MKRFLEKLKHRPQREKDRIVASTLIVVAVVLLIVWFFASGFIASLKDSDAAWGRIKKTYQENKSKAPQVKGTEELFKK